MTDKRDITLWAPLAFLLAPLLPEYIAPAATVVPFFVLLHKKRQKGTLRQSVRGADVCTRLLVAFILWQIVGLIYSDYPLSGLVRVLLWTFGLLGMWFVSETVSGRWKRERVFFAGTVSGGIAGFIGTLEIILFKLFGMSTAGTVLNPFWHSLDSAVARIAVGGILPDFIVSAMPRTQFIAIEERASATFSNPIYFAAFLVAVMPFAAYCLLYFKDIKKRVVSGVCLVFILVGVAVSYSRGPYVALALTAAVLIFYGGKRGLKVAASCVAVTVAVLASDILARMMTAFDKSEISVNLHNKIWLAALDVIKGNWFLGLGTGVENFRRVLEENHSISQPHAHNIFLQITVENGVVGLGIFVALVVFAVVALVRLAKTDESGRGAAVTLLASLVGMLACGMTDCIFYGPKPLQLFFMLVGLASGAGQELRRADKKKNRRKASRR